MATHVSRVCARTARGVSVLMYSVQLRSNPVSHLQLQPQVEAVSRASPRPLRLLFCHATGFCKEVWMPVIEDLLFSLQGSDRVTSLELAVLDFNGHGDSREMSTNPLLWPENNVQDVMSVLKSWDELVPAPAHSHSLPQSQQSLGASQVIGIGHSMGGGTLLNAELKHPGTFSELVLYEPITFMPNEVITLSQYQKVESKLTKATKSRRESFPNTEDFEQYLSTRPAFSRWDARVRHAYAQFGLTPSQSRTDWTLKCRPSFESVIYSTMVDIWEQLPTISAKAHFLAGEHTSEPPPLAPACSLQAHMSRTATFTKVMGAGHFGPMEQPSWLGRFLAGVVEASATASSSSKL
eukprot:m.165721 g.165721  ORF g.165721 m.165721 type:complete len:351 (-) comp53124_c0_seq7:102-1154(-)